MFMWPITIRVLCMTHESTATAFCVNKNLYIWYIYVNIYDIGMGFLLLILADLYAYAYLQWRYKNSEPICDVAG